MNSTLFLTNHSTLVKEIEMIQIAAACSTQILRDLAPAHGLIPVPVIYTRPEKLPARARVIDVVDVLPDGNPQALAWHTEDDNDHIYGYVGVKPYLDNGGSILDGPMSVSVGVSHEIAETLCDPFCSAWADTNQGFSVCWEVADPVEGDCYAIGHVTLTNFVTLNWFNPFANPADSFDHLGVLRAPFSLARGGYWVQRDQNGNITQRFGEDMPEWRRETKKLAGSRAQRIAHALG